MKGAALLAAAIFSVLSLSSRWRWEADRSIEICVDGEELAILAGDGLRPALARLGAAGAAAVAVYWDGSASPQAAVAPWSAALPDGMSIVLRPRPGPFSGPLVPPELPPSVSSVLFAGPAVWGFPDLAPAQSWLESTSPRLPLMEFTRQLGAKSLLGRFPARVVRGHSLDEEEMARTTPAKAVLRFRRAVRERGIRFLYIRLFPGLSVERNADYVASLAGALREEGFVPGAALPRYGLWGRSLRGGTRSRQALAFLAACLIPAALFRWACRRPRPLVSPVLLTASSLAAALFVAAILSTPDFALGYASFRGVKPALAVPLGLAFLSLYSKEEILRGLSKPLTVGLAAVLLAAAAAGALYILRSGHESGLAVSGAENRLRTALETWLAVRPRFKEFLIGHPLLWLGFYLFRQNSGVDARPLLLAGFVGQLSIVNTFCHPHVPLAVSLVRTFHGFWLGALLGGVLIGVFRLCRPR